MYPNGSVGYPLSTRKLPGRLLRLCFKSSSESPKRFRNLGVYVQEP